jgi:hypothetical protein
MSNVEQYAKDLQDIVDYATEFKTRVERSFGGSFKWGIGEVIQSYLSLFDRFCPFEVGDQVQLKSTCHIENIDHGWYGCGHFMVKGATAIVKERGYTDGQFTFLIAFDVETWIDDLGEPKPVERKHVFHFGENALCLADKDEK